MSKLPLIMKRSVMALTLMMSHSSHSATIYKCPSSVECKMKYGNAECESDGWYHSSPAPLGVKSIKGLLQAIKFERFQQKSA